MNIGNCKPIVGDILGGGTGGNFISGKVSIKSDLPGPPYTDYVSQIWFVEKPSGFKLSFSLKGEDWYKYPAGPYVVNTTETDWVQAPFSVQIAEDAQTLLSVESGKWVDYFNVSADIGKDNQLIYDGVFYKNLTGVQTSTPPDIDTTNWSLQEPKVNFIDLVDNIDPALKPFGRLWSNNGIEKSLNFATGIGPVANIPFESWTMVYNGSGAQIDNGTAVNGVALFNGYTSIVKADNKAFNQLSNPFITTMDIPDGTYGICTSTGRVRGIDTTLIPGFGPLIYIDGDQTLGLTRTRPEFPNYRLLVGAVAVESATVGELEINIQERSRDTLFNTFDGGIRESFDFRVTSDGATITGTLTNPRAGQTDLTLILSKGFSLYDASSATISLTAGTATVPQLNYVYITSDTEVLTVSTTGFPTDEHSKVAKLYLQDATTVQSQGALRNQNINDHIKADDDNGHLLHIAERLRQLNAAWDSGALGTLTGTTTNVYFAVTSGVVWQLHQQSFPSQDMATGDGIHVVNDPTTPYRVTTNLNDITVYSTGSTWNNEWSNLVLWGVANKTGEISHIMVNLPSDGYNSEANAIEDSDNFTNYTIPAEFKGVGFLIGRFTIRRSSATFTYNSSVGYLDLRGFFPNNTAGGGAGSSGITEFTGLTDTPSSYTGEAGKIPVVNSGETALEFYAGIKFNSGNININPLGSDQDFILQGVTDSNLFICDAGLDTIAIGKTPTATYKLNIADDVGIGRNLVFNTDNEGSANTVNTDIKCINSDGDAEIVLRANNSSGSIVYGQFALGKYNQLTFNLGQGYIDSTMSTIAYTYNTSSKDRDFIWKANVSGDAMFYDSGAKIWTWTGQKFDFVSTTGALLVPRMTTTQRDAFSGINGMIIYNTTTNAFNWRANGAWVAP